MSLKSWLVRRWLRGQFKQASEGKMGDKLKKAYWWLAGKKTITGLVVLFAAAGFSAIGNEKAAEIVLMVGGFLTAVGLADKLYRAEPPKRV